MVVVTLVAILAVLALPSMGAAKSDRHAYDDAGDVMQLFRTARTRAVGRGAAQLVHMLGDQTSQHGRFEIWEAVAPNPTGNGLNRVPVANCKTPTVWTLTTNSGTSNFVDAVDMNGVPEQIGQIWASIIDPTSLAVVSEAFLCFTPVGRVYYYTGSSQPNFDVAAPFTGVLTVQVTRGSTTAANTQGALRTILVPGSGMARLVSQ